MVWIGTVLAFALAAVGFGAWWLLKARRMPLGNWIGVVALAVWLAGVSITGLSNDDGSSSPTGRDKSIASLAWPEPTPSPLPNQGTPLPAAGGQAASVESLVARLEARLAAQPNDAEGWSLLAQSYAFTSNEEQVEIAVRHAVELGVDERQLRDRVESAKRGGNR